MEKKKSRKGLVIVLLDVEGRGQGAGASGRR